MKQRICMMAVVAWAAWASGCGTTSYGASKDGKFPPRPAGAEYLSWEHMCVKLEQSNITKTLNESGTNGWELVAMGSLKADTLMCFKRPSNAATDNP